MAFQIRERGRHHISGDPNCPACESVDGRHWPQWHRDIVSSCVGLVHVERFRGLTPTAGSEIVYYCDGCKEESPI